MLMSLTPVGVGEQTGTYHGNKHDDKLNLIAVGKLLAPCLAAQEADLTDFSNYCTEQDGPKEVCDR